MSDFVEVIRDQFQKGRDSISLDSEFRNLEEWSSMQSLFIIAAVDEAFGVALKEEDFRASKTIKDLWDRVKANLADE